MLQIILIGSPFPDPWVISYINVHLSYMWFSLRKDIISYKDICYFYFFNNGDIFFMISIYSNDHQSALKYLKDTEVNLYNVLIMAGDFNIRNSNWDLSYPFIQFIVTLYLKLLTLSILNYLLLFNRYLLTIPTTETM